ncbi:MAG: hypothetical protein NC299_12195 [Lachnospiraceae bacterium]|nr:hypothetical protein [Ruminococcus sp.]MCM1276102.1 hypothetical protein [Lachnospiraceae bacterium]
MKLRQALAAVTGTAVVIGSLGTFGASAADVPRSEGINVAYHTRDEIRSYIAKHPFDMDRQAEYAQSPAPWYPYRAGKLSDTDLKEALNALNSMRYIAGVGVQDVVLCPYSTQYAQAAALVNCVNKSLSHNPTYVQKIDATTWAYAKIGAQNSNVASGFNNSAHSIVLGYLYDTNEKNISALGHRRWCLNPPMYLSGFGHVNGYSAMYATDAQIKSADNYGVCWPAQNMPVEYFPADTAWSISMGYTVSAADVEVTLTRQSDGEVWTFSNESADGYFNVNNESYGQTGCIIFRPDGVEKFSHGDVYSVEITGLKSPVSYNVSFFGLNGDDSVFADGESPDAETSAPDDTEELTYEPESKEYSDDETGISITAEPGTFPVGTTLRAEPVESGCTSTRYTCDLSFVCGGSVCQPTRAVNVSVPVPARLSGCSDLYVYHVQNGRYVLVNSSLGNGCITFGASGFSPYVISSEKLTEDGEPEAPETPEESEAPESALPQPVTTIPDSTDSAGDISEPTESAESVESAETPESSEPESAPPENHEPNPATGVALAVPFIAVGTALFAVTRRKK